MIAGKVVGEHLAVQAPNRMHIAGTAAPMVALRDVLAGDRAVVVGEDRFASLAQLKRGPGLVFPLENTGGIRGICRIRGRLELKPSFCRRPGVRRYHGHKPAVCGQCSVVGHRRNNLGRNRLARPTDLSKCNRTPRRQRHAVGQFDHQEHIRRLRGYNQFGRRQIRTCGHQ